MSWSTSNSGTPAAVLATTESTLNGYKCPEPEETIKGKALEVIREVLNAQPEGVTVSLSAYGSQSKASNDPDGKAVNSLTISITATR